MINRAILYDLGLFAVLFASTKLAQFLLYNLHTSPALIWPQVGIALAAVILRGYKVWPYIFLAQLAAVLTSPTGLPIYLVLLSTLIYTLQPLLGAYVLRRSGFNPSIARIRDSLDIIILAAFLTCLGPAVNTWATSIAGSLTVPTWVSFTRGWVGGVMSVLIFTPFLTSWFAPSPNIGVVRKPVWEKTLAILSVAAVTYVVFWTTIPQLNIFIALYLLFAPLFWIGLRMGPRIMTLALFTLTSLGIVGSIVAHPGVTSLGQQLFADELFILLIGPVFFILSTLVEERRVALFVLNQNIRELQFALQKISSEDQAKSDFLAILAHELRNPLASIVTNLEVAKMQMTEVGRPDIMHYADIAVSHVSTVTRLLDDLLDVSHISRKKVVLRKEPVELQAIVNHAIETVEPHINAKKQVLFVSMPQKPLVMMLDPLRVEQIMVNLLTNASKYCQAGGRIELGMVYSPEKGVRINVRDNGIGLEPHMLEKIFDPFTQVKQPKDKPSVGLGVGLSLTKQLVELHKGAIWVESEGLGHGSDFIIVLPTDGNLEPAERPNESYKQQNADQSPVPQIQKKFIGKARNVLIVDDNKPNAYALQLLLERNGHSVMVVHDGPSAFEELKSKDFDIILLDIGMPDMDGYEVAAKAREQLGNKTPTLVALTGYGQKSDKEKAFDAGFNYHLTKPVSISQIEDVIAQLP